MCIKLSIITVTLNSDLYIKHAIDSVIAIKNSEMEYIIIDGGSTDRTVDIISNHHNHVDYWVSEKDNGIYDAINKGISVSSGKWIYVLGSDDIILPDFLDMFNSLTDVNTIYYGNVLLQTTNKAFAGKFNTLKMVYCNIPHQAIFYPKILFDRYKYNMKYRLLADYALNLEVYGEKEFIFRYMPYLIARYNDESGISSKRIDDVFGRDKIAIIKRHFPIIYPIYYFFLKVKKRILIGNINKERYV